MRLAMSVREDKADVGAGRPDFRVWPAADLSLGCREVRFLKVTRTAPCVPPKAAVDACETCRGGLTMSVHRGRPEENGTRPK